MKKLMQNQSEKEINENYSDFFLLYTRRSTDDPDNQKNSIDYQIMEGLRFASNQGLRIAPVTINSFCENGIIKEYHSGFKENKNFEILSDGTVKQWIERPKFLMLAEHLQKKSFKGIICLCWDRISRNKADDVIIDKLRFQGVDFRFVQASYEDSSAGALHMDVDGMFSRHYSRVISEKVKNTARKLRAEGKCLHISPLGYIDNGSSSKPFDPQKAPIVKRLFELYATGKWSYAGLAKWANEQGLTTKPSRRRRTKEEKLMGLSLENMPKATRKITGKTIEKILLNPFYIGKNVSQGKWIESTAHHPLIDVGLFLKVRQMQGKRRQSARYPEQFFATYRGLIKCQSCGRKCIPYVQKGLTYYRLKCRAGCTNTIKNISEKKITSEIMSVLDKIYFSDSELEEMAEMANEQLDKISSQRNTEMEDLYRRLKKIMADYDYLIREKITLLRTNAMSLEEITIEEYRLKDEITNIQSHIEANTESTEAMYEYVITFSRLVKERTAYFQYGLDSDKRNIAELMFAELLVFKRNIICEAKEGYGALLGRLDANYENCGGPLYLFSKLAQIYMEIKLSAPKLLEMYID